MNTLHKIQNCFKLEKVYYSRHAKEEMQNEEYGRIKEQEVFESILSGQVIKEYPEDKPYPSVLIFGNTKRDRPLHIVCAYNEIEDLTIIITVYQPNPLLWIDYITRRN